MPLNVFISYSHADEWHKHQLEKRLAIIADRFTAITVWSDSHLLVGDKVWETINEKLRESQLFIPLVSTNYLASSACWKLEYARAKELFDLGTLHILPIIVSPCSWHKTIIKDLLCAPKDGRPVTSWPDPDEAWLDVENALHQRVEAHLKGQTPTSSEPVPPLLLQLVPTPLARLRPSGVTELLPPIEFLLGDELLHQDYGELQLFFNTNLTSRLIDDPVSESFATIEHSGTDPLPPVVRAFEINGVQVGANSLLFRSFPLHLLRTANADKLRVSVRHARVNISQLGSGARVRVAVRVKHQGGEWLTEGDVGIGDITARCALRTPSQTGAQLMARLRDDHHQSAAKSSQYPVFEADLILTYSRLDSTDVYNPACPVLIGVYVQSSTEITLLASLYNIEAGSGSTARLVKSEVNGALRSPHRAEEYSATHLLALGNEEHEAVAIAESQCVWKVSPGHSIAGDSVSVLLSLIPSHGQAIGKPDFSIHVEPFLAPMTTVTTASSLSTIPRFTSPFAYVRLDSDSREWALDI